MTSENQMTIGQAIDAIIKALEGLKEKDRAVVIKAASDYLSIHYTQGENSRQIFQPKSQTPEGGQEKLKNFDAQQVNEIKDIRTFKESKAPGSQIEMACIVAYYLSEEAQGEDQKQSINAVDIQTYFKQAKYRLPKRPVQVLVDSKAAGYLDSVTGGNYKLNPVGYNLVVHGLPRKAGKGAIFKPAPKKSKKAKN